MRCPLLALWGDKGVVNRLFDPLRDWGAVATDVAARRCRRDTYLAEEAPDETLRELRDVLRVLALWSVFRADLNFLR